MSPRAACRLATLGFTDVYDYAAGKVDWLAHGLPAEGSAGGDPTAGSIARDDVATCSLEDRFDTVLHRIADSPYGYALVLSPAGVLLGRVRRSALRAADPLAAAMDLMDPGPSTVRPHVSAADVRTRFERSRLTTLIVTTPDGVLLGVVRRDDVASLPG